MPGGISDTPGKHLLATKEGQSRSAHLKVSVYYILYLMCCHKEIQGGNHMGVQTTFAATSLSLQKYRKSPYIKPHFEFMDVTMGDVPAVV